MVTFCIIFENFKPAHLPLIELHYAENIAKKVFPLMTILYGSGELDLHPEIIYLDNKLVKEIDLFDGSTNRNLCGPSRTDEKPSGIANYQRAEPPVDATKLLGDILQAGRSRKIKLETIANENRLQASVANWQHNNIQKNNPSTTDPSTKPPSTTKPNTDSQESQFNGLAKTSGLFKIAYAGMHCFTQSNDNQAMYL